MANLTESRRPATFSLEIAAIIPTISIAKTLIPELHTALVEFLCAEWEIWGLRSKVIQNSEYVEREITNHNRGSSGVGKTSVGIKMDGK